MFKKTVGPFVFTVFFCFSFSPALARAATLYVAPTDTGAGDCSSSSNRCDLAQALLAAQDNNADNTILMDAGSYTSVAGFAYAPLNVDHTLILTGAGQSSTFVTASAGIGLSITSSGTFEISGITFRNSSDMGLNVLDDGAGSLYTFSLHDCTFSGNGNTGATITDGVINGSITIEDNTFENNTAPVQRGGALNIATGVNFSVPVVVHNNLFDSNTATTESGGAAYIITYGLNSPITLTNNVFQNNTTTGAGQQGGAAVLSTNDTGSITTVGGPDPEDANTFTDNSTGPASGGGGALFIQNFLSGVSVQGNTFTGNTAEAANCGAVLINYVTGLGEFSNNIVQDNSALNVGGFQLGLFEGGAAPTMIVNANLVSGNSSSDLGGGALVLENLASPAVVTNNLFVENAALLAGATVGGLGIFSNDGQTAVIDVTNNTFADNTSEEQAGGLFFSVDDPATVINATNNIFWNNTATSIPGNDLYIFASAWGGMNFNANDAGGLCVDPNAGVVCSATTDFSDLDDVTAASNLYDVNPLFLGTGDLPDSYTLQSTSPMIAAADPDAPNIPTVDYTGGVYFHSIPDMGALQFAVIEFSVAVTPAASIATVGNNFDWTVTVTSLDNAPTGTLTATITAENQNSLSGTGASCTGSSPFICSVSSIPSGGSSSFTVTTHATSAGPITFEVELSNGDGTITASASATATAVAALLPSSSTGCALGEPGSIDWRMLGIFAWILLLPLMRKNNGAR